MTKLTEHTVLARTRAQDLRSVRKLNAWGSELSDVSIVKNMPNVEVLSLSVNNISSLQDFAHCKNLQELYLRKNKIKYLHEIKFLKELPNLHSFWLSDNPCADEKHYRLTVIRNLPQLEKLDNELIKSCEVEEAKLHGIIFDDLQDAGACQSPNAEKQQLDSTCDSTSDDSPPHSTCVTSTPLMSPIEGRSDESTSDIYFAANSTGSNSQGQIDEFNSNSKMSQGRSDESSLPGTYGIGSSGSCQMNQGRFDNSTLGSCSSNSTSMITQGSLDEPLGTYYTGRSKTSPGRVYQHIDESSPGAYHISRSSISQHCDFEQGFVTQDFSEFQYNSATRSATNELDIPLDRPDLVANEKFHAPVNTGSSNSRNTTRPERASALKLLPKGGRNRNANILSAVLCLIKELDLPSLEVVDTAVHCQMEELDIERDEKV